MILSHLRPALSWAVSMGLLASVPEIHRPQAARGRKLMRGRPITGEEFDRIIEAVSKVPRDTSAALEAVSHRPLALGNPAGRIDDSLLGRRRPVRDRSLAAPSPLPDLCRGGEGTAGSLLPMTPDFAEFIQQDAKV